MASGEEPSGKTFVERAPTWLRWGGGTLRALIALLLAVIGAFAPAWPLYLGAVFFLAVAGWWCFLARIAMTIDDDHITLVGPWWKRTVKRGGVHDVLVAEDSGTNPGAINWPVTSHRRGSLLRMNMGGAVAVTFTESGGRRYQFVLADPHSADRMARIIES